MRKKALRKDFYMEIRKSFGRFLSIFFIVAIGTAFFSGIRAAEPDMRLSGDAYFDKSKLMDLQVVSTMGLTADDLQAIREVKGVNRHSLSIPWMPYVMWTAVRRSYIFFPLRMG